jgi:hypothetical protein
MIFLTAKITKETEFRKLSVLLFVLFVVKILSIQVKIPYAVIDQHRSQFVFRHTGEIFGKIFL